MPPIWNFGVCVCVCTSVFDKLIWRTISPKSFLFGTAQFSLWASGAVNYDYIVTNSINSLLIGSRCIPNGTHTNHCWGNLAHASKHIKTSGVYICFLFITRLNVFIYSDKCLLMFYCLSNLQLEVRYKCDLQQNVID